MKVAHYIVVSFDDQPSDVADVGVCAIRVECVGASGSAAEGCMLAVCVGMSGVRGCRPRDAKAST